MINKVFKDNNKKYLFIINNFFQLFYFKFILKEYKINNYIFLIPNYKNYLKKYLFLLSDLNYKVIDDINIRWIPFSLIDIIKYKKRIINILPNNYKEYNIIATTSNNLLNKIFLWIFNKNRIFFINTTPDSLVNRKQNLLYNYIYDKISKNKNKYILKLNFLDLKWEYFFEKYKKDINILNQMKEKINIDTNKKIAIFLWQNHKELWLSDKEYIKILLSLKNKYKKQWTIFYIKPHPLDDYNYLNFNLIDKTIPWELLNFILNKENTELLTFFSSTILTINANKKRLVKYEKDYNNIQKHLLLNI